MKTSKNQGFTLVEIMIVVVIIGLLAAMGIPRIMQARQSAVSKSIINDARTLGHAASTYMTETPGVTTITLGATTTTGVVTGVLSTYVGTISKGTAVGNYDGTVTQGATAFTMSNLQAGTTSVFSFDTEGKLL